jgi:thiol-disulfide isomerase/thioredoxin
MKLLSFAFLLFGLTVAYGAPTLKAPEFTVRLDKTDQSKLIAIAPANYHFNIQAPMSLKVVGSATAGASSKAQEKPESATEAKVTFKIPGTASATYHLSIYMCDDAKTFCEKHEVDYSPSSQSSSQSLGSSGSTTTTSAENVPAESAKTEHGFIVNDPDRAFALAKKQGKPLLIDFYGIWCPPCNELDEKVFPTAKFSHSASRFIRLKLDADQAISWKLKSRYQVSGYPTVVLTTSDGDEITRIVGYRALPEFLATLDTAWKTRDATLEKLEAKAATGDRAAADQAGLIHLDRGEAKAAATLLQGTKSKLEFLAIAEIQVLEDEKAPNEKRIARLNQAIQDFPKTPNTIDWFEQLSKIQAENQNEKKADALRRESLTHAIELSLELSKKPELLKGYDATPADLLEAEAGYHEDLDGSDKAKQDWLNAAQAYADRGVGTKERANNLERAFCLGKAGELQQAQQIYQGLEQVYPNEFTFYYYHARTELGAKQSATAVDLAAKAYARSYGDNRLRVALLLAQAYKAHGDNDKSKLTIDETLKGFELPADPKVRSNRYLAELKKMRESLN